MCKAFLAAAGLQARRGSRMIDLLLPGGSTTLSTTQHRWHWEPRWHPAAHYTAAELPSSTRNWLLDDGSLTRRLIELDRGKFTVRRLIQSWQPPLPSERSLLGLPQRQLALVREVVLHLDQEPVVFARSVFPVASLAGELRHLRRLQNRSLGAILFTSPGMRRSPFELATLAGNSRYLPDFLHQRQSLWGRRSRFDIHGNSLMVSEVFLPRFRPWPAILAMHRSQRGKIGAAIGSATQ